MYEKKLKYVIYVKDNLTIKIKDYKKQKNSCHFTKKYNCRSLYM